MEFLFNEDIVQKIASYGYEIKKKLGQGSFGTVFLVIKQSNKQQYAIKMIDKQLVQKSKKLTELFQSEKHLMSTIKSSHVIQMIESYESDHYYYLVIEYCNGGDLLSYLQKRKFFLEKEAIGYFIQLLNGFKDLHSHYVIHRDIKLENILRSFPNGETGYQIDDSKNVILKIADLGLAKDMKEEFITFTQVGTIITKAPEVMRQKPYGFEVDIYSLGVILYQMVQGKYPFYEKNEKRLLQQIKTQYIEFRDDIPPISDSLKDLIRQMLKYKRKERIKWSEILNHQALQFPLDLTQSKRLDDSQYEELDQSRLGFERNNDLYDVSYHLPHYKFRRTIDSNHQSVGTKIYFGFEESNKDKLVAVKQIKINNNNNNELQKQTFVQMKCNYEIIKNMNQDYIMKIQEFKQVKDKFYIVSEYFKEGNLFNKYISNKKAGIQNQFNQEEILTIFTNILQALQSLHNYKMVHRNISSKTIYISQIQQYSNKSQYKLGGFKNIYQLKSQDKEYIINNDFKDINPYIAPEILENKIHTISCDIYSLGIVLYELIYGDVPYQNNDKQLLLEQIYSQKRQCQQLKQQQQFDKNLLELIDLMIQPNEKDRINFQGIWDHIILKQYFKYSKKIIQEMFNFYEDIYNNPCFLSQYIEEDNFKKIITSSLQFEQQTHVLPILPQSSNQINNYKFNYRPNSLVFIQQQQAIFPIDQLAYKSDTNKYSEIVNNQKQLLKNFKNNYLSSEQEEQEKQNKYYDRFVQEVKDLIEQGKQFEDFELCIYYTNVLKEIKEKKDEYDRTYNLSRKKLLLQELHSNYYDKVFKR